MTWRPDSSRVYLTGLVVGQAVGVVFPFEDSRYRILEVSRGNLKDMSWTFAQIIERASYGVRLLPGDVIGSGTVGVSGVSSGSGASGVLCAKAIGEIPKIPTTNSAPSHFEVFRIFFPLFVEYV